MPSAKWEDALSEIDTYKKELAAIDRQQKAAKNANELSRERYDKGVASYLEVLDTERTLFNAELKLSELTQLYRSAHVSFTRPWAAAGSQQKNTNRTSTRIPPITIRPNV